MRYELQGTPTNEQHGENIIRLYVRDASGAPVSGARVRVFAGPPPTGRPAYFEDDFPFRPTSPAGLLEFFAVAGVMPETRHYWAQVIDASGNTLSDPVQFHFPKGATIWITAILRQAAASGVPTTPTPATPITPAPVGLDFDARLKDELNIIVEFASVANGAKYWKLVRAKYLPEGNEPGTAQGRVNMYYTVLDESGNSIPGQRVWQQWPDDRAAKSTGPDGVIDFNMSGDSSFDPKRGQRGPYSAYVDGLPSDKVVGLGLPLRRHVVYELTWRRAIAGVAALANSVISGAVSNAPAGTQVTLSGAANKTALLDASGNYAFTQLAAGAYSIAITGAGVVRSNLALDGANSARVDYAFAIKPPTPPTQPVQPTPPVQPGPSGKTLTHYLLLGAPNISATRTNLILALDYIARFAPVVGFSADEAKAAANVTLVGAGALSAADEQKLRDAGCIVRKITGADSYAMEKIFSDLIAAGNPFPNS